MAIAYTHEIEDTADTTDYVVAAGTGISSDSTCDKVLELWDMDTDALYVGTWVSMDTTTAEITVDRNMYGEKTFKIRITYDDAYRWSAEISIYIYCPTLSPHLATTDIVFPSSPFVYIIPDDYTDPEMSTLIAEYVVAATPSSATNCVLEF